MAYWLNSAIKFKSKNRKAFICDTDVDLVDLPTTVSKGKEQAGQNVINDIVEMGSLVYSIGSKSRYCLNSKEQWIKIRE
ncbi:MAG: hypothetical protein K5655_04440 [Lachnospiraceae bacterium]|nr:hypothetical protein [Lachnospiraceae bacterium]